MMRISCAVSLGVVALALSATPSFAQVCEKNMVKVGPLCIDQYEAIVVPHRPDLMVGNPEGHQFGRTADDYPCQDNGNDCSKNEVGTKIWAVSWPAVTPSRFITWFQAQQACANSGKRLLRSGEWQMAAAGTPDGPGRVPGCNTNSTSVAKTGSHASCVSNFGVFDMVGNAAEWVEDWIQPNSGLNAVDISTPEYGEDLIHKIDEALSQGGGAGFPPALVRGGSHFDATGAGVFALAADRAPSDSLNTIGFRCAKEIGTWPMWAPYWTAPGRTP